MTSEEIQMYAGADFQEGWEPKVGDKYHDTYSEAVGFVDDGTVANQYTTVNIYLPSIERMAEMWHEKKRREGWKHFHSWKFLFILKDWLDKNIAESWFDMTWPLHIIILAFIQSELFQKTWDGKAWVKG